MKIIEKIKLYYHLKRVEKSLITGDKVNYDKHTSEICELLWNQIYRA